MLLPAVSLSAPTPPFSQELVTTVKNLTAKMEDLSTCSDLVGKHGTALVGSLNALKVDKILVRCRKALTLEPGLKLLLLLSQEFAPPEDKAVVKELIKTVNERSALLKLTSGAMVKAATDFLHVCKHDGKRWTR